MGTCRAFPVGGRLWCFGLDCAMRVEERAGQLGLSRGGMDCLIDLIRPERSAPGLDVERLA